MSLDRDTFVSDPLRFDVVYAFVCACNGRGVFNVVSMYNEKQRREKKQNIKKMF